MPERFIDPIANLPLRRALPEAPKIQAKLKETKPRHCRGFVYERPAWTKTRLSSAPLINPQGIIRIKWDSEIPFR